jgi:hypothetical protein
MVSRLSSQSTKYQQVNIKKGVRLWTPCTLLTDKQSILSAFQHDARLPEQLRWELDGLINSKVLLAKR